MRAFGLIFLLAGCANQLWSVPQPQFSTREPGGAFERAVWATRQHCGGVSSTNAEAQVVIGPWEAHNTGEGLVLTQCLVTVLRGDEHVIDVRVTFAARQCPLSSMDELEQLAPTCPRAETVPESVKNRLEDLGKKLEGDIRR